MVNTPTRTCPGGGDGMGMSLDIIRDVGLSSTALEGIQLYLDDGCSNLNL